MFKTNVLGRFFILVSPGTKDGGLRLAASRQSPWMCLGFVD